MIIVIVVGEVAQDLCHRACHLQPRQATMSNKNGEYSTESHFGPLKTNKITQQSTRKRIETKITFVMAIPELPAVFIAILLPSPMANWKCEARFEGLKLKIEQSCLLIFCISSYSNERCINRGNPQISF